MARIIEYPFPVGAVLTRVLEVGGGKECVLFLHGLGARADRWRLTLPTFAEAGYRCLAMDLPGHGFAAKGAGTPCSVPEFAALLGALLAAMGLDRVHLVGTSLGGHVAAYFTCENPDKVCSLTLVGAVGLIPIGRQAGDAIRQAVTETGRDSIDGKMRFVFANHDLIDEAFVEEEYRINNSPGAATGFRRLGDYIAEEIDRDNVGERLAGLANRPPVLLVWGALDKAVPPAIGEQAQALLGDVPLILVQEAGHAPYLERPDAFDPPVLRFISSTSG